MTVTIDEGRLAQLTSSFSGRLLRPTDEGYEDTTSPVGPWWMTA